MKRFQTLKNVLLLAAFALLWASCDSEEPDVTPDGEYKTGVFVANQGQFPTGAGSVTFIDRDSLLAKQAIFESVNGRQLGSVVQSISVHEGNAYIMVNNADRVEIADAETFEEKGVIENVIQPRYFIGIDANTGYLSGWGENGTSGYIKVINLADFSVTKTILTGVGTDRMLKLGSVVYAVNSGHFTLDDSTVVVINTLTGEVAKTIDLGAKSPKGLILDANDKLWVLTAGVTDWGNPANSINGKLVQINTITNDVESDFDVSGSGGDNLIYDGVSTIYYTLNGQVYQQSTSNIANDNNVFIAKNFYGLGFDSANNHLYGADAGNFASDGQVFRYNTGGNMIDSFPASVVPGNFTFVD